MRYLFILTVIGLSDDDLITRLNLRIGYPERQLNIFSVRFRVAVFFLKKWMVPGTALSRGDIVKILLRFVGNETGLTEQSRPFTNTLASPRGREAESVEEIMYEVHQFSSILVPYL